MSSDGGRFQRWAYTPPGNTGLILAGWWPDGKGLLLWTDPSHSASIAADGLPLVSLPRSGGPGVMLTDSRPYRPWLTWSPDGGNLLVVTGDDREPWDCKTLTLCRPLTGSCRALPQPPSTVSLDPAWSRDGTQIAFVRAPARGTPGAGGDLGSWYPSRRLWMADAAGSGAHEVPGAGEGVSAPRWGTGGSTVRFSTASAIRSIPAAGGTPETLAGSLTGGDDAEWAAAGKQPWAGVAVWASAP